MSILTAIDFKKGYPFKKAILCGFWLTILLGTYGGIRGIVRGEYMQEDVYFFLFFSAFLLLTFFPLKKYVLKKNLAFPYLRTFLTSAQLEYLLENETFAYIEDFKGTTLYKKIRESEHWLSVNGFYFYKPFVVFCSINSSVVPASGRSGSTFEVIYVTGERVEVNADVGHVNREQHDVFYTYAANSLDWIVCGFGVGCTNYDRPQMERALEKDKRELFDLMQDCGALRELFKSTVSKSFTNYYKVDKKQ